ncbi:MAG: DtxR family transcriptional regulator [Clostridia bacterium]|nr:DtxR family transcriptional regulator [Clostridia bacterium]
MDAGSNSDFRTVRGYQLYNRREGQLTPAMEDYLEMAYRLHSQNSYARVGKLSELLHVKPSSASKMIFKLAELGYLVYDRYEIILLTEKGRETGAYLLKRHDILEAFLKLIGCAEPLEETELIEHSLSPATVSALNTLTDFFDLSETAKDSFEEFRKNRPK